MRRFSITSLALLLILSNTVVAADIHEEAFSGQHYSVTALHPDNHCDPGESGENHPQCHHCCHAQGHFSSLLQRSLSDRVMPGHDWLPADTVHPHPLGYAPPVPPPKA